MKKVYLIGALLSFGLLAEAQSFMRFEDKALNFGAKVGFNNIDAIKFNFEYYYGKEKSVDAKVNGVAYPWYYQRYVSTSN